MPFHVEIESNAAKEIRGLPREEQRRIMAKIESLAANPRPPGCVKLAGATDLWRVRAGVYRIVYRIRDKQLLVTVVRVAHRREVYRDM